MESTRRRSAVGVLFSTIIFHAYFSSCMKIVIVQDDGNERHVQYSIYINASAKFLAGKPDDSFAVSVFAGNDMTFDTLCTEADSQEIFVVSLTTNAKSVEIVRQFSNTTGIRTVHVQQTESWIFSTAKVDNFSENAEIQNYITFVSPELVFYQSIIPVFKKLTVTHCVILHDEIYVPNNVIKRIFGELNLKRLKFVQMAVTSDDVNAQLNSIHPLSGENLILMGSMKNVQDYAKYANTEGHANNFKWFIFTRDINPYICDICSLNNTFWIRPDVDTPFSMLENVQDFISDDLEHKEWIDISDQLSLSFYFDLTRIIFSVMNSIPNTTDTMENITCTTMYANETVNLSLSEIIFQDKNPSGRFGAYWIDSDGKVFLDLRTVVSKIVENKKSRLIKTVGNWSLLRGLNEIYGSLLYDVTLPNYSIVTAIAPPFIESYLENGTTKYRGYCIDLLNFLQEELQFEYTLYPVRDNLYGALNSRGQWNGLIRDLMHGHADMALAGLSVTAERENYVDFTVPYYDLVGMTILMRRSESESSLFKFMTVLTPPVWLCIVAAYFFTSFVMWLFDKYSPYGSMEEAKFTFTQCLWYCMTALTPQGGPEAPNNISCKLIAATWWLFGFIIIASYTANLAAFLTVSRLESSINSLDDLSKQYKIKYAPIRGSASEAYFRRMANIEDRFYDIWKSVSNNDSMTPQERASLAVWDYPVSDKYTNIWRFMTANGLPNSTEEAINLVLDSPGSDDGFAFIGLLDSNYIVISSGDATSIRFAALTNCRLTVVGGEFNRKPYALAVQQLSPLKDVLSGKILKLSADRKLEYLKDKWWKNNPKKVPCPEVDNDSTGISVKNIAGVFLIILGGIAFSIITLIFEYFCMRNKEETLDLPVAPNNGNTIYNNNNNNNNNNNSNIFGNREVDGAIRNDDLAVVAQRKSKRKIAFPKKLITVKPI